MAYEDGMQIVFDLVSKMIVISFRGDFVTLGPFPSQRDAMQAGERYCRDRGWLEEPRSPRSSSE